MTLYKQIIKVFAEDIFKIDADRLYLDIFGEEKKVDTRTGEIVESNSIESLKEEEKKHYKILPPHTYVRPGDKVGRNDPCPCMSGKKFKRCCMEHNKGIERELRRSIKRGDRQVIVK